MDSGQWTVDIRTENLCRKISSECFHCNNNLVTACRDNYGAAVKSISVQTVNCVKANKCIRTKTRKRKRGRPRAALHCQHTWYWKLGIQSLQPNGPTIRPAEDSGSSCVTGRRTECSQTNLSASHPAHLMVHVTELVMWSCLNGDIK